MFPTISHIIEYFTGWVIPLPFNTFGFFMATAFAFGYWVVVHELKRKEKQGLITSFKKTIIIGEPPKNTELAMDAFLGFILGYKFLGAVLQYDEFMANTELYILSKQGSVLGGILLAILFVYWSYKEKKQQQLATPKKEEIEVHPYQMTWNILVWAALVGILGAKFFHNLEYWDEFVRNPIGSMLSFSGLTFYGGLLGGACSVLYYTHKKLNIPMLETVDIFAPTMMIAYAVGRIGCHLSGDGDWGIVSNMAKKPSFLPEWLWSSTYPHNVINEGVYIPNCVERFCHQLPQGVYPTPLYEALVCLVLFGLLWWLKDRIKTAGILGCIYLILNGIERFSIEKIRVNSLYHAFGMSFTQAELISSIMMVGGGIGILFLLRKNQKAN